MVLTVSSYKSIRIDALHSCELEEVFAEERKRKARGDDDDDRFGKKQKGGLGHSYEVSEEELGKFI